MIQRRKRKNLISVPTSSMSDIAFLLIIFFMVCSQFTKESNINFKPASSPDVATMRPSGLSVVVDCDGLLFLNGAPVDMVSTLEETLKERLRDKTNDIMRTVLFKCDVDLSRKKFEPVLSAIVNAGGVVAAVGDKTKTQ